MTGWLVIAGQEWRTLRRNRWLVGTGFLMLALAVVLAALGDAPAGGRTAVPGLGVLVVSLTTLGVYFVPLLGLLLGHDAVIAEAERGTLALTMSYPLTRDAFIAGKAVSHTGALSAAVVVGFGVAGAIAVARAPAVVDAAAVTAFLGLILSTVWLGLVFLLLGYVVSAAVRERATAVGLSLAVWLGFVILYDLGVIGLLVAMGDAVSGAAVEALLFANPTDVYRLFNLIAVGGEGMAEAVTGAGMAAGLQPAFFPVAMVLWLGAAAWLARRGFARREL